MNKTHLLCYVHSDRLTSWKLDSLNRGTRKPVLAYGSNDRMFANFAKRGNVLWVIGSYRDGPPSLEARIVIAGQLRKHKEWKCEVKGLTDVSEFFGRNDASSALMKIVFGNERSFWTLHDRSKTWKPALGQALQAPRKLAPAGVSVGGYRSPGVGPLAQLARVAKGRSVFISWKHIDNNRVRRQFIKALTIELAKRQFSVWWDRMALTNVEVMNEYSQTQRNELMSRLLRQGLSQCSAMLAVWTRNYGSDSSRSGNGTTNWTRNEWNNCDGVVRFALSPDEFKCKTDLPNPNCVIRMPPNPTVEAARSIAARFSREYESIVADR